MLAAVLSMLEMWNAKLFFVCWRLYVNDALCWFLTSLKRFFSISLGTDTAQLNKLHQSRSSIRHPTAQQECSHVYDTKSEGVPMTRNGNISVFIFQCKTSIYLWRTAFSQSNQNMGINTFFIHSTKCHNSFSFKLSSKDTMSYFGFEPKSTDEEMDSVKK